MPGGENVSCSNGVCELSPGVYRVRFNEVVSIPQDSVGFCYPRSSLIRMGGYLGCAVWDPGYMGRGQALLLVANPHGLRIEIGARVAQLVVARVEGPNTWIYSGDYQGEGL